MYNRLVALALLTLILGFTVTGYAQEGNKPPLSKGRIAGELFAGVAGGVAVGTITGYLLYKITSMGKQDESSGWVFYYLGLVCIPIGYAVGSAAGVYLVGNYGNETGSFSEPAIGGSLAGIIGFPLTHFPDAGWKPLSVLLVGVSAIATIIFNFTREYKSSTATR